MHLVSEFAIASTCGPSSVALLSLQTSGGMIEPTCTQAGNECQELDERGYLFVIQKWYITWRKSEKDE